MSAAPDMQLRRVEDNLFVSESTPAVRLQVDPAFRYVGRNEPILYGIAHAELHLFVEANELERVRRLLWVQFEHFPGDSFRIL